MVGGTVVEVLDRDGQILIDCEGTGSEKLDTCAIYVMKDKAASAVQKGDKVWWQGNVAFWTPFGVSEELKTPETQGLFWDIQLTRMGPSFTWNASLKALPDPLPAMAKDLRFRGYKVSYSRDETLDTDYQWCVGVKGPQVDTTIKGWSLARCLWIAFSTYGSEEMRGYFAATMPTEVFDLIQPHSPASLVPHQAAKEDATDLSMQMIVNLEHLKTNTLAAMKILCRVDPTAAAKVLLELGL